MLSEVRKIIKSIFVLFSTLILATLATNSYFSSQAKITDNVFSTGNWTPPPQISKVVINEVYYDVAADKGADDDGVVQSDEWVELYNPGDTSVDVRYWVLQDASGSHQLFNTYTPIPAHGFALISQRPSTWTLYWPGIPQGVLIIENYTKIGNGLANDGDRLILKDDHQNIVDQISYGNDTTIFNPSIPTVAKGHSIERQPAGKYTGTAADFIDQVNPTPGLGI